MLTLTHKDINLLSCDYIKKNIKLLLSDDSDYQSFNKILYRGDFIPQSFTVGDILLQDTCFNQSSIQDNVWLMEVINFLLTSLVSSYRINIINISEVFDIIKNNLYKFLIFELDGKPLKDIIWNQEFINIAENIIRFSLFGKINNDISTHVEYNYWANKVVPELFQAKRVQIYELSLSDLLKISIASGATALDLKGSFSAAAAHSNVGIPFCDRLNDSIDEMVEYYYAELRKLANSPTPIFEMNRFIQMIENNSSVSIVYFTDDNFESYFDLLFIQQLLKEYDHLKISIVPKNGYHGNDTSYVDLLKFILPLNIYEDLNIFIEQGRLSISCYGPRMGAVNLFKLSNQVIDLITNCTFLVIKGCRAFELIQGGLNKPLFSAQIVLRDITEIMTGYDTSLSPILFSYLAPGEYAFFGVKPQHRRVKEFSNSRMAKVCLSTFKDHQKRLSLEKPEDIIFEFNRLMEVKANYSEDVLPLNVELNLLAEKLLAVTEKHYNQTCQQYSKLRGKEPDKSTKEHLDILIDYANKYSECQNKNLSLIDIGTGSGRDLKYASKKLGLKVFGIDNSNGFIGILDRLSEKNVIPRNSYTKADMRNLSFIPDESFDITRFNCSLLHLPIVDKGYMADLALEEGRRILKKRGLIYVQVKMGDGLQIVDTREGLGGRIFQMYSKELLIKLLERNGFNILLLNEFLYMDGREKRLYTIARKMIHYNISKNLF